MSRAIDVIARCAIHPGKLDAFREIAAVCLKGVTEKEKGRGALRYDWFLREDGTHCVVIERYRDSAAVLEHIANLGSNLAVLAESCDLTLEVYGRLSPELVAALAEVPVHKHTIMQGLDG